GGNATLGPSGGASSAANKASTIARDCSSSGSTGLATGMTGSSYESPWTSRPAGALVTKPASGSGNRGSGGRDCVPSGVQLVCPTAASERLPLLPRRWYLAVVIRPRNRSAAIRYPPVTRDEVPLLLPCGGPLLGRRPLRPLLRQQLGR